MVNVEQDRNEAMTHLTTAQRELRSLLLSRDAQGVESKPKIGQLNQEGAPLAE